jgi:hypothetical protein
MKPYVVVKYSQGNMMQVYYTDMQSGRNRVAFKQEQDGTEKSDEFEQAQDIYFCDSEDDANSLADMLLGLYPQYIWAVAAVGLVISRPPGPVTRAKFTEKGLLPV